MTPPRIKGSFKVGGAHDLRPRGSLVPSEARELTTVASVPGAYSPDGTIARDTLRLVGEAAFSTSAPAEPLGKEVIETVSQEVIWGGVIMSHFGHFLVESVARLWVVLPDGPLAGIPVVFHAPVRARFAIDWLDAFGVEIVELPDSGAVRFKRMFVPEAAWRTGAWIAPEVREIHLHARRGLDVRPVPDDDVVWLSRSRLTPDRAPYDEALLEWLLGGRVTVASPETMTLAEQVALFEGSRAVVGVAGSAFHTLLMVDDLPQCLYLCPPFDKETFSAQHRLLDADATFVPALRVAAWTQSSRINGTSFPNGYRLSIPESLRALQETLLPALLEDARLAAFADPEGHWGDRPGDVTGDDLDAAIARMLLEPRSADARLELGARFEAEGLEDCAREQFAIAADLKDDPGSTLSR